jgi:hypothetical protein
MDTSCEDDRLDSSGKAHTLSYLFRQRGELITCLILSCIVFIPFFHKIESQDFHQDENVRIHDSKFFKLFFIDSDIDNPLWQGYFAYDYPPVGKYLIGLSIFLLGDLHLSQERDQMEYWNPEKDRDWNTARGAMPSSELLRVSRLGMTLFGFLTCILIYGIGRLVFDRTTGVIACLLLAWNPLMLTCSRRAMADAPVMFFLTVGVLLMIFFYRSFLQQKTLRTVGLAVIIGIDIALAAGTKLNGGLSAILFVSFCILIALFKQSQSRFSDAKHSVGGEGPEAAKQVKIALISVLVAAVIAILVFDLSNPYLYDRPLRGWAHMVRHRMLVVKSQQEQESGGQALTSLSQKTSFVLRRTMFQGGYVVLGNLMRIPIDFALFVLGFIMTLCAEIRYMRRECGPTERSLILLWVLVLFVGIILWIPLDWPRYYLPVVPCVALLSAYSLKSILGASWSLVRKRLKSVDVNPIRNGKSSS